MLNSEVKKFIDHNQLQNNTGHLLMVQQSQASLINEVEGNGDQFDSAFKEILRINQLNIELQLMKQAVRNHQYFTFPHGEKLKEWDFVVEHYKDYHGCGNVARSGDLTLLMEEGPQGQGSESMYLLENEFGGNTESHDIAIALIEVDHDLFLRAITDYCADAVES